MKILTYGHSLAHPRQRKMWEWIARQGHKVDTIVPPNYQDEVYKSIKEGSFTQHLCPPYTTKAMNMWYFPQLHDLVMNLEPDILFSFQEPWTYASYYGLEVANLFRVPFGFFTWENIPRTFPQPWRRIEHAVIGQADLAIGGNVDAAQILLRKGAEVVVNELQTGLDPNMFFPEPKLNLDNRTKPRKIVFIGRLTEAKGIKTILAAFDKLPKDEYILQFVGGRGELEGLITSHPDYGTRIGLEPWTDYTKIPEIYNSADISVMPSLDTPQWIEQCGYSVGESLLCHVPVITSLSKSISEIWKNEDVYFVGQGDIDMLATFLMEDNIYKPAKLGRQFTIENYSIEKVGQRYIDLFEATING